VDTLNKTLRFNILHLILWSLVSVAFLWVFLEFDAIANWGDNALKSILLALLFVVGFGGDMILRFKFKLNKDETEADGLRDSLRLQAMESSYIATLLYIFIAAISIYIRYEDSGLVPVGWLWFLAYSLILVVNIASSLAILIMHHKNK